MHPMFQRRRWLIPAFLVMAGCSQNDTLCSNPDQNPDCVATIEQALADAKVPGVSVSILENHRLVRQWSLGFLAEGDGRAVRSSTPFQAGDLSQLITALGVLAYLQQSGTGLDQSVNEGLSRWQIPGNSRWSGDDLTLRHLLSHRSGLTPTRYRGYLPGEQQPGSLALLNGEPPANTEGVRLAGEPGNTCHQSAAAYEILALWLEEQTSGSFTAWLNRSVFTPLNVPARYRLIGLSAPAQGHDWQGDTLPNGYRRFVERGSSGLWASPSDIASVMLEIMAAERGVGRILTDNNLINEMLTPQGCGVGLGVRVERIGAETLISYDGISPGYRTYMLGQVQSGNGVVVMTNGDRGQRIIDGVVKAVRRDYNW